MTGKEEQVAPATNETIESPQEEKMVPQSQVNDLVGRAKAEAREKAMSQANAEYQQKLEALGSQQPQTDATNANNSTNSQNNVDAMAHQVRELLVDGERERRNEEYVSNLIKTHENQKAEGEKAHTDFKEVTKNFNPVAFPHMIGLMAQLPNGGSVLYELTKNPMKLSSINSYATAGDQQSLAVAQSELKKLSDSILVNQKAVNQESQYSSAEPLDRIQSSNNAGNNGEMSVSDYRKQPWLKG